MTVEGPGVARALALGKGVESQLGSAPLSQLALSVWLLFLTFNISVVIPGSLQFLSTLPLPERRAAGS